MLIHVLKGKIHRARITKADLHYEGSISIGRDLLDASAIRDFEKVEIYNVSNGERFATYAIEGPKGEICLNGAAAWKGKPGDIIIIAAYGLIEANESFKPKIALVDSNNCVKAIK